MSYSNDLQKLEYIELQHILSIYSWHISESIANGDDTGLFGILSEENLHLCLSIPIQEYYDEVIYPTIAAKAAAYLFYFVKYHIFGDANKRASISIMLTFLLINGCILLATFDELYAMSMRIADEKSSPLIERVIDWIEQRLEC